MTRDGVVFCVVAIRVSAASVSGGNLKGEIVCDIDLVYHISPESAKSKRKSEMQSLRFAFQRPRVQGEIRKPIEFQRPTLDTSAVSVPVFTASGDFSLGLCKVPFW